MENNQKNKRKPSKLLVWLTILLIFVVCFVGGVVITGRYFNHNFDDNDNNTPHTLSSLWPSMFKQHKIKNNDDDTIVDNYVPYDMIEEIYTDMDHQTKVNTAYPEDKIQSFLDNRVSHENSISKPFEDRVITGDTVPYDGGQRSITCWGDSMTEGNGTNPSTINVNGEEKDISFSTFPSVLQDLTGITTYNLGVGGETSIQIAQRQGGIPMVTDRDLNIPNSGGVDFQLVSPGYDVPVDINDYSGYGMTNEKIVNQVYINNHKYKLTFNGDSHMVFKKLNHKKMTSKVNDPMGYTSVPAGTRVYTTASIDRKDDILVIEMGSNGGWNGELSELIQQYDAMIEFANCDYYIILGDTDDPGYLAGLGDTPWEAALREAYGDHFMNMRTYLIRNGLSNCGLTTSYADMECYYNGQISKQLRSDFTHLNALGYYAKGVGVYEKGVELGYWN